MAVMIALVAVLLFSQRAARSPHTSDGFARIAETYNIWSKKPATMGQIEEPSVPEKAMQQQRDRWSNYMEKMSTGTPPR